MAEIKLVHKNPKVEVNVGDVVVYTIDNSAYIIAVDECQYHLVELESGEISERADSTEEMFEKFHKDHYIIASEIKVVI